MRQQYYWQRSAIMVTIIGAIAFSVALFSPFFAISPSLGPWLDWIAPVIFGELVEDKEYSVLSGLQHLLDDRDYLIVTIVFVASVALPYVKFFHLIRGQLLAVRLGTKSVDQLTLVNLLTHLDMMLVVVLMVAHKEFPGGTRIELRWGFWLFLISTLLAKIAVLMWKSRRYWGQPASHPCN